MMSYGNREIHNKLFLACLTAVMCMAISACDLNNKTEAKTDIQPTEEASNDSEEKDFNKNTSVDDKDKDNDKSSNDNGIRNTSKTDVVSTDQDNNKETNSNVSITVDNSGDNRQISDVSENRNIEAIQVSYEEEYEKSNDEISDYSIVSTIIPTAEISDDILVDISNTEISNVDIEQSEMSELSVASEESSRTEETSTPTVLSEPSKDVQESLNEDSSDVQIDIPDQSESSSVNSDTYISSTSLWCITNKVTVLNNGCAVDRGTYLKVLDNEPDGKEYLIQWYEDTAKVQIVDVEVFEVDKGQEEMILLRKTAGVITKD